MSKAAAFTSASGTFPSKIFKNQGLVINALQGVIQPVHIQLNPTNKCNLKCSFCSCAERDRNLSMDLDQIEKLLKKFSSFGCRAVTITGGGEPLLHDHINDIIECALRHGISAGLVTNGLLLKKIKLDIEKLTWIRVSVSDESDIDKLLENVAWAIKARSGWSFSYVVSDDPQPDKIATIIEHANKWDFTHVRIVNDILDPSCDLEDLRQKVLDLGVNDKLAIWQDRQHYSKGVKKCLISLLKPVIGADGMLYPCCGAQYAEAIPAKDYSKNMKMGSMDEIEKIWSDQACFDGSNCTRCYYGHYNQALEMLTTPIEHERFV